MFDPYFELARIHHRELLEAAEQRRRLNVRENERTVNRSLTRLFTKAGELLNWKSVRPNRRGVSEGRCLGTLAETHTCACVKGCN
jgi:hypothetical protein